MHLGTDTHFNMDFTGIFKALHFYTHMMINTTYSIHHNWIPLHFKRLTHTPNVNETYIIDIICWP